MRWHFEPKNIAFNKIILWEISLTIKLNYEKFRASAEALPKFSANEIFGKYGIRKLFICVSNGLGVNMRTFDVVQIDRTFFKLTQIILNFKIKEYIYLESART